MAKKTTNSDVTIEELTAKAEWAEKQLMEFQARLPAIVEGQQQAETKLAELQAQLPAIREEAQVFGMIKKIDHDLAYNQLLKYTALARLKERKAYRNGGMTWAQFCEAIGESDRSVDRILSDLRPLYDAFSANLAGLPTFDGLSFNKIRYLGTAISANRAEIEDGALVVDGIKIPLKPENKEEIEALIDNLRETHQKEKADLEKAAERERKRLERETRAQVEALEVEKKALVKENTRLKVFDPEERDHTWCEEQAKEVEKACLTFVANCQKFIIDERISDDRHLQARANHWIDLAERHLADLRQRFEEMYSWAVDA
ncbi:MAG: hypothetical protein IH614_17105 [Desulfuromonadales bacterium]|nr:hypothetical protein [Desulfuromonadales bacterium]